MLDYLIIGQGLGGSLLGWKLHQQGQHIHIIDNQHKTSSSTAAAGLMNPVTGMRLVKAFGVEEHLSEARKLYAELEAFFAQKFYHSVPMARVIKSEKQIAAYEKRSNQSEYAQFIGEKYDKHDLIHTPHGWFEQQQTGYLDIPSLLTALASFFTEQSALSHHHLDYGDIEPDEDTLCWNGLEARSIIFCEGYKAMQNPWFDLPFQPSKGEIITIKSSELKLKQIMNAGSWLLPIGDDEYRLGATNDWGNFNEEITQEARDHLFNELHHWVKQAGDYSVVTHKAGVRPATLDKQPFLGESSKQSRFYMFNGFGAHGSIRIPFYANAMIEYLLNQKPLPKNVDIGRLTA